jgi:hypothetical protein
MPVEVAPLDSRAGSHLDEAGMASGILPIASIAEAALVEVHEGDGAHSIT